VIAPTGTQYTLSLGSVRATITQVAAALRGLSVDSVDIVQSYPQSSTPPFAAGIVLVPWPNRIEDGRWMLDGQPQQLDLTEPKLNNAIHGLLRFTAYSVVEQTDSALTLGATVFPQHGYPFLLETTVRYELTTDGVRVTHGIHNLSDAAAPVAIGTHPFLKIGDVPSEELILTVHASTRFPVDARLLPMEEIAVDGTDYDLRAGRPVAELDLDDAFGDVQTVHGASATLTAPDGRQVRLLQDDNHPYVQIFTTRDFPADGGTTLAVAMEPMTAPANAFNSGLGLTWLDAGQSWSVSWGIQYSR
jgi:aldose 1-epimerase